MVISGQTLPHMLEILQQHFRCGTVEHMGGYIFLMVLIMLGIVGLLGLVFLLTKPKKGTGDQTKHTVRIFLWLPLIAAGLCLLVIIGIAVYTVMTGPYSL